MTARTERSIARNVALGLMGGLAGSLAMNLFVRLVNASPGREGGGAARGADRYGRGVQPAQAHYLAEDDAATRTAVGALRFGGVVPRSRRAKRRLGVATHYAFGASMGVLYALAAHARPAVRQGFGMPWGTLVWAVADEGLIPALGLSRGPRRLSPGLLAFGLAGHWVYGMTLEAAWRLGARVSCVVEAPGDARPKRHETAHAVPTRRVRPRAAQARTV